MSLSEEERRRIEEEEWARAEARLPAEALVKAKLEAEAEAKRLEEQAKKKEADKKVGQLAQAGIAGCLGLFVLLAAIGYLMETPPSPKETAAKQQTAPGAPELSAMVRELAKASESDLSKRWVFGMLAGAGKAKDGWVMSETDVPAFDACMKVRDDMARASLQAHGVPVGDTHVDPAIVDEVYDRAARATNECLLKAGIPPVYATDSSRERAQQEAGETENQLLIRRRIQARRWTDPRIHQFRVKCGKVDCGLDRVGVAG